MGEISVGERYAGRRLGELMAKAPAAYRSRWFEGRAQYRRDRRYHPVAGDAVLVVAEENEAIARAAAKLGKL